MILFQEEEISVRSLEPEDAELLVKWLSDPVVLEYYEGRDRPHNIELVMQHFYENREEITQCIVQYKSMDIGYIQFYIIDDEEREEYDYKDYQGTIYGMDQFIGEVEFWNRGIGSRLIKAMVTYLIETKVTNKIIMDPQAWNKRALRVYEKNGFVKKKYLVKHEWHEGEFKDCWLIEYEGQMSTKVNFGNVATDYAAYRDALPNVIFEQLKLRNIDFSGKTVVDLGSGSGIFCRALSSHGATVIGIEPEMNLINEAKVQDTLQGCRIRYIHSHVEVIRLPDNSLDVITALRSWHWFERDKVITEAKRLLKSNGHIIIIHSIFVPHLSEEAQQTLGIIKEAGINLKPAGSMADVSERRSGLPVHWFQEWEEHGFHIVDEWQHNYDLSFSIQEWCGKVRSLSWMTNINEELKQDITAKIKDNLSQYDEPLIIPHQYSVVVLKNAVGLDGKE